MKINNEHRRAVAAAWHAARERGEDQATFCARQVPPIATRTLRQWAKTFTPRSPPLGDIRLIHAALANLQLLADELERARIGVMPVMSESTTSAPKEISSTARTEPTALPVESEITSFWDSP